MMMTTSLLPRPLALLLAVVCFASFSLVGTGCMGKKNTTPSGVNVPFSRLKPGMGARQMVQIAGDFDDQQSVYRGSGPIGAILFIPLIVWDLPLFLNKTNRINIFFYKGQGRVIFNSQQTIRQVIYDPTEDGYIGEEYL